MQTFKNKRERLIWRKLEQALINRENEQLRQLLCGINIGAANKYRARNNRKINRIAARV